MPTPLVDALADYRDRLVPPGPDGRPRRWWPRMLGGLVATLALTGALLAPNHLTLTGPPTAATTTAPPAPAAPPPPADAPAPALGDATLAAAPPTRWQGWSSPVVRTWLPRIAGAGPSAPPSSGFARTPAGALAAAASLYPLAYYSSPQSVWADLADTRVQWAPGQRAALAAALEPVWRSGEVDPLIATPVGYRLVVFNPDHAQFRLWWVLDYPDGRSATVGALADVVWAGTDWQLFFDEPAMDLRGISPTDTYVPWSPR